MSHITSYSGRAVGTVIDYPEHADAMRPCYGRTVRLGDEIAPEHIITTLDNARMVADNMAQREATLVILEETGDMGDVFYMVYALDGEIKADYTAEGIIFSNMQKTGQDLPKNVRVVEIYDRNKNAYEMSVLDTKVPHPYPVEGDHYYCGVASKGSFIELGGKFHRRVHYVYHTRTAGADLSGRMREVGVTSSEKVIEIGTIAWFLDEAKKKPSKVLDLGRDALMLAGPEIRADLIRGVLYAEDLDNEEKAIACLGLFRTIPKTGTVGRNIKEEVAYIFENFKNNGLSAKLLEITPVDMLPLLVAALDVVGAPDGLFNGTYDKSDMALAGGYGTLVGVAEFLNGTAEFLTNPVPLVEGMIDLTQTAADRLAVGLIGGDNLPEDVSQRLDRTEATIGSILKHYNDFFTLANRFGVGGLVGARLAGAGLSDATFVFLPVAYGSRVQKFILMLGKL